MKFRMGFVSNSSTSSFMIVGTECSKMCRDIRDAIKKKIDLNGDQDGCCYGSITYEGLEIFVNNGEDGPEIYQAGVLISNSEGGICIKVNDAIDLIRDAKFKAINAISEIIGRRIDDKQVTLIAGESSNGG